MQDRIDALIEQFQEAYDWADIMKSAQEREAEMKAKKKPKKVKPSARYAGLDYSGLSNKEKAALAKFAKKMWGSGKPKGNLKQFMATRKKIDIMPHKSDPTKAVIRLTATNAAARKEMANFLTVLGLPNAEVVVGYKRTMAFVPKSVIPKIKAIKEARELFGDVMLRQLWESAQQGGLEEA